MKEMTYKYIDKYINNMDISPSTARTYAAAVKKLYRFMAKQGCISEDMVIDNINNRTLSMFFSYIEKTYKGYSTVINITTAVRQFVRYLYNTGVIPSGVDISIAQAHYKKHPYINPDIVDKLDMPYKLMAMLIINHNLTINNVINLKITNINSDKITIGYMTVQLTTEEIKLLIQYLEHRKHIQNIYLFVDDNGNQITSTLLNTALHNY
jgi:site-specific recombinase XerD